ncbi:hypothetical protein CEP53_014946 [Fusarium sp. AF-6]|nr:hypothetical protein CEP53_014946 [Fusarium sp. AF-6]
MALAVSASQRSDRQAFAPAFAGYSPPQEKEGHLRLTGWTSRWMAMGNNPDLPFKGIRRSTESDKTYKDGQKVAKTNTRAPSTAEKRQPLTLRQIGGRVRCRNNLATHRPMSRLIHHGCFLDGRDLDGTQGLDVAASRWSAWRPLHHVRGSFDGEPPQSTVHSQQDQQPDFYGTADTDCLR